MRRYLTSPVAGAYAYRFQRGDVTSFPAGEELFPGRFVELGPDGRLRLPQGTSQDIERAVGVVLGDERWPLETCVPYRPGDIVPVLRRGRVWAPFVGAMPTDLAAARVMHSPTTEADRGKLTMAAPSGVVGAEIAPVRGVFEPVDDMNYDGLVIVSLNL